MSAHSFAPVFRAPMPDADPDDTAAAYQRGYDDALGELYDSGALSWSDAFGRRHMYFIRCGRKLGGGRRCFRRGEHAGGCDPRWEL